MYARTRYYMTSVFFFFPMTGGNWIAPPQKNG